MAPFRRPLGTLVLVVASIFVLALQSPNAAVHAEATLTATLVIDTSLWPVPAPIRRASVPGLPATGWSSMAKSKKSWVGSRALSTPMSLSCPARASRGHDSTSFIIEPAGMDSDVAPNGHFYISDDSHRTIFEIDLGREETSGPAMTWSRRSAHCRSMMTRRA